MSGLVFESGGLSISHGMTRGLSAVPGVASALHGHQVAYGLLVQLELERRDAGFMQDMRAFHRSAGLPLKLVELGADQAVTTIGKVPATAAHMKVPAIGYGMTARGRRRARRWMGWLWRAAMARR